MSLKDDLDSVLMEQTSSYKEESCSKSTNNFKEEEDVVDDVKVRKNPFKSIKINKLFIIAIVVLIISFIAGIVVPRYFLKDEGAKFLDEMEESTFEYSLEDRELLRVNGYTGDDIERFEIEERDVTDLVEESEQKRQEIYDAEIKPILDGASPEYKKLKSQTWVGSPKMSDTILSEDAMEERVGTYNCDYEKIDPCGTQLFLKLDLKEFKQSAFITVTANRYRELENTGNIVVVIEYDKYSDDSILITDVREKDIAE